MQSAISLIQAVIWPVIVILMLVYFGPSIRRFMAKVSEFGLKLPGGFEATGKLQMETAAKLGAANVSREGDSPQAEDDTALDEQTVRRIADVVTAATMPATTRRLRNSRILWVDDRPSNNRYERAALENLGVQIDLSTSTDEALDRVRSTTYDAIISDMGRPPDPQAGYTLLEAIRKRHNKTPFIIYAAGANRPEHRALARHKGATGSTNDPQELFEMVLAAIRGRVR